MSHSDALERYAEYVSAKEYRPEWGSATNVDCLDLFLGLEASNIATLEPAAHAVRHPPIFHLPATTVPSSSAWSLGNAAHAITIADFSYIGAFDEHDELQTPEATIRLQVHAIRAVSLLPWREPLAERLELLVEGMREEGEAWTASSAESLRKMMLFLETVPHFRLPAITITPAATFRAQWTEDTDSHFAIDFLPDGQVHFVVFCPDPRHPERIKRLAGKTSWENLMRDVAPYNVGTWSRAR